MLYDILLLNKLQVFKLWNHAAETQLSTYVKRKASIAKLNKNHAETYSFWVKWLANCKFQFEKPHEAEHTNSELFSRQRRCWIGWRGCIGGLVHKAQIFGVVTYVRQNPVRVHGRSSAHCRHVLCRTSPKGAERDDANGNWFFGFIVHQRTARITLLE